MECQTFVASFAAPFSLFATCSVRFGHFSRERRQELSQRNRARQFRRMLRLEALATQRNRQRFAVAIDLPSPGLERSAIATSPEDDCVVLVGRHAGEHIAAQAISSQSQLCRRRVCHTPPSKTTNARLLAGHWVCVVMVVGGSVCEVIGGAEESGAFDRGVRREDGEHTGVVIGAELVGPVAVSDEALPQAGLAPVHLADVEDEAVF
jgi:hypothetical protein